MTRIARPQGAGRRTFAALLLAALPLAGCAATASTPVRDLKAIAGRWEGNLTVQASEYGARTTGATWVIREDGTYEMSTKRWVARGTMRLEDGKILFFDGRQASGIASLHEGPEGRYLSSAGDEPGTFGSWKPAQ